MKIGVMKIGANITQSKSVRSAGNFDIFSLTDLLTEDHTVGIITKKTRNTILRDPYVLVNINNIQDINDYDFDCLMVFNGAINFFGGNESPETIMHWKLINHFKGRVYYIMSDLRYPFQQILDYVNKKDWGLKYEQDEENYLITRKDIRYIYQGRNIVELQKILDKKIAKRCIPIKEENIHSFPIQWAIMANEPPLQSMPWEQRTIDLIYGGANRDSHRKNRLLLYFYNNPLQILTFGPIKIHNRIPSTGAVSQHDFMRTMSKSKATIIVGDKLYQNNFFTLRMYESILSGCVTFIDSVFDRSKKFYEYDEDLCEFLYVTSQKELVSKIKSLTEYDWKVIANKQLQCVRNTYENPNEYKKHLERILQN